MMDCATNSAVRSSKVIPGDQNVESLFPVKVDVPESLLSIAHDNDQPRARVYLYLLLLPRRVRPHSNFLGLNLSSSVVSSLLSPLLHYEISHVPRIEVTSFPECA